MAADDRDDRAEEKQTEDTGNQTDDRQGRCCGCRLHWLRSGRGCLRGYAVDIFCLFSVSHKVYRGIANGVLPPEFWKANAHGVRGGVEAAFMSTTTDRAVAAGYSKGGGAGLLLEMPQGMVCNAATTKSRATTITFARASAGEPGMRAFMALSVPPRVRGAIRASHGH